MFHMLLLISICYVTQSVNSEGVSGFTLGICHDYVVQCCCQSAVHRLAVVGFTVSSKGVHSPICKKHDPVWIALAFCLQPPAPIPASDPAPAPSAPHPPPPPPPSWPLPLPSPSCHATCYGLSHASIAVLQASCSVPARLALSSSYAWSLLMRWPAVSAPSWRWGRPPS